MTTHETFLARMQPLLEAMPEGPDKEKLLALIEAQDTVERSDVSPKDRARAMRRLTQIDSATNAAERPTGNRQGRGRPA